MKKDTTIKILVGVIVILAILLIICYGSNYFCGQARDVCKIKLECGIPYSECTKECYTTYDILSSRFTECKDSCGITLDYCACERGDDFACIMLEEE
ncbi:hypothetical protein HN924_02805 [Candidatus Woesearchaeota archaeon]|jgi:hypothetical protein|nr:hypothetical protein [Candidatus Woesearchaeota archaeon]MBT7402741.1 hypothetical protein [Candidatus Woesearchaeota archaeon]